MLKFMISLEMIRNAIKKAICYLKRQIYAIFGEGCFRRRQPLET